jgi:hypothetical protein
MKVNCPGFKAIVIEKAAEAREEVLSHIKLNMRFNSIWFVP